MHPDPDRLTAYEDHERRQAARIRHDQERRTWKDRDAMKHERHQERRERARVAV